MGAVVVLFYFGLDELQQVVLTGRKSVRMPKTQLVAYMHKQPAVTIYSTLYCDPAFAKTRLGTIMFMYLICIVTHTARVTGRPDGSVGNLETS